MSCRACLCAVCTWATALVGNVGILVVLGLALLYWEQWPYALGGSFLYLLFLLFVTRRQHAFERTKAAAQEAATTTTETDVPRRNNDDDDDDDDPQEETQRPTSLTAVSTQKVPVMKASLGLSMLYFLTNLVLAFPGAIVVFFAFPCTDVVPSDVRRQVYWKTNATTLPTDVQDWFETFPVASRASSKAGSSLVQVGSLWYVYGSFQEAPPQLYAIQDVAADPIPLGYQGEIRELTVVTDSVICFIHMDRFGNQLLCGNNQIGFQQSPIPRNRFSFGLVGMDGKLWFLQIRSDYYVFDPKRGGSCNFKAVARCDGCFIPACRADTMKVVSVDVATMETTSHSRRYTTREKPSKRWRRRLQEDEEEMEDNVDPEFYEDDDFSLDEIMNEEEDNDDGVAEEVESDIFCDGNLMTRLRAFGALFLSAIPVVFHSCRVWVRHAIPSMSVSLFLGIGMTFFYVWGFFYPQSALTGFGVWLAFGTPLWLLVCTYQLVVNPRVSKAPLWWSLYFISTALVCLLVAQEAWEFERFRVIQGTEIIVWVFDILFLHFPLLVIAILTKSAYIGLLDIFAFLLLSSIMIWRTTDTQSSTMLYGSIVYVSILVIALCVYRARQKLHTIFYRWLSACARHTCAIEVESEHEEADSAGHTTSLLLNEEGEEA